MFDSATRREYMATSTMEKVTNNSGSKYCKMPDGTLIQWGVVAITTGTTKSALGYASDKTIYFPIEFINAPDGCASPDGSAGQYNATFVYPFKDRVTLNLCGHAASETKTVHWFAIGRWK